MINFISLPELDIPDNCYLESDLFFKSRRPGYLSYNISNQKLLTQLENIFKDIKQDIGGIAIQEILPEFSGWKHIDPREIAINYLLDLGGDNVMTSVYSNTLEVIDSKCLPLRKWHYFYTSQLHGVDNITSTRIAISVTIKKSPSIETIEWLEKRITG